MAPVIVPSMGFILWNNLKSRLPVVGFFSWQSLNCSHNCTGGHVLWDWSLLQLAGFIAGEDVYFSLLVMCDVFFNTMKSRCQWWSIQVSIIFTSVCLWFKYKVSSEIMSYCQAQYEDSQEHWQEPIMIRRFWVVPRKRLEKAILSIGFLFGSLWCLVWVLSPCLRGSPF